MNSSSTPCQAPWVLSHVICRTTLCWRNSSPSFIKEETKVPRDKDMCPRVPYPVNGRASWVGTQAQVTNSEAPVLALTPGGDKTTQTRN